ncbi:MAG: hypothetical protein J5J00_16720 [Deltaproteobacteria bacterium]|nr:hypothetical protein [Deltaproteobacteria bacterium]
MPAKGLGSLASSFARSASILRAGAGSLFAMLNGKPVALSVIDRMTALHGLPQKVLQYLDLHSAANDRSAHLDRNFISANPIALSEVRKILQRELGPKAADIEWLSEGAMTASIGQVHMARLRNGEAVVVKVQYPHIGRLLKSDLSLVGLASLPAAARFGRSKLDQYRQEIKSSLELEINYRNELRALQLFQSVSSVDSSIRIPVPLADLCSNQVLVMRRLSGMPLLDCAALEPEKARPILEQMLRLFLHGIHLGEFHADPHPGNFAISTDNEKVSLVAYDFGCTKQISVSERDALLSLMEPRSNKDHFELYAQLGFEQHTLQLIQDKLPNLSRALFAPFHFSGTFPLAGWRLAEQAEQILGEHRIAFRLAGPAGLIHIIRVFSALRAYAKAFGVDFDWNAQLMEVRSMHRLEGSSIKNSCNQSAGSETSAEVIKSTALCVRVDENGATKVQLTLKPELTELLKDLIPPEVLQTIYARNIDLDGIVAASRLRGHAPGELFSLQQDCKCYRVWLE